MMEPEVQNVKVQKLPSKFLTRKVVVVSLITFILLMLAITAQFSYMILNYGKVYKGVYVGGTYAGNLKKEELSQLLQSKFADKNKNSEITLKCKDITEKIRFSDISVKYDINKAVDSAYEVGRSGNIFQKFSDILKARKSAVSIDIPLSFDKKKVNDILQDIYQKTLINVKEADLFIQEERITIRSGHHGENIDKDKAFKEIEASVNSNKGFATVQIQVIVTAPSRINVSEYYSQINREVKDATFKVENNKLEIIPEVWGRSINKDDVEKIATELEKTENTERVLPVTFIKPKILTSDVHSRLFKDVLYTVKTHFNTNTQNNKNRSENIKLASSKISGKMLAPGEIFSFNETVGERTVAAGYKDAYVYKNKKVVPDLAGGICQVSSTLYNAVLQSDLEIVDRRNHMYVVSYVKPGRDATIFGSSQDFKFKNSTKWPIRIDSYITKDNYLVFTIKGTNENPGKVIELSTVIRNEKDFSTNYTDDPNLPEGQTKVLQEGHKGLTADTYKTIKINGKVIESKKISTNTYLPLNQEVARGTKKVQVTAPATNGQKPANPAEKPDTQTSNGNPGSGSSTGTVTETPTPNDTVDPGQ